MSDDFFDNVGGELDAAREKLKDVEYIKSLNYLEIIKLIKSSKLDRREIDVFWSFYLKQVRPDLELLDVVGSPTVTGFHVDLTYDHSPYVRR